MIDTVCVTWLKCTLQVLRTHIAFLSGLEELHSLVEQAETSAFPKISLVDQLRTATAEADKVAVMAQQLLNGKRQTRYEIEFDSQKRFELTSYFSLSVII